jgi:hypothetical protein
MLANRNEVPYALGEEYILEMLVIIPFKSWYHPV